MRGGRDISPALKGSDLVAGGRRLWRTARRLTEWLDAGVDVFAYFNNDYEGHAVHDAQWLRTRLDRSAS